MKQKVSKSRRARSPASASPGIFRRKVIERKARVLGYDARYLHFPVARKTKKVLVCFHGWLDNAASFVPLAEHLKDYEIFAWDFLGHGRSEHKHPGERYHYIDLVPFIGAAIEHIQADSITLVGHSMGAGACALYAGAASAQDASRVAGGKKVSTRQTPAKIERLVLIEGFSPMTAEPGDAAKILNEGLLNKSENLPKPVYKKLEEMLAVRMRINGLTAKTALPLVERASIKIKNGYTWRADFRLRAPSLVRMTFPQVQDILEKITVPTLVVLGENGMPQLRHAAEQKGNLFRNGQIRILPGHHHLHMDNAVNIATEFRNFCRS